MTKTTLEVPTDINKLSDWAKREDGYKLSNYPYHYIFNKQITGCGFTYYCLTCNLNVILCSPRRVLLENKETAHKNNGDDVFYYRNNSDKNDPEFVDFDKDIKSSHKGRKSGLVENIKALVGEGDKSNKEESLKQLQELNARFTDYYVNCITSGKPCKILVTYDSFRHVKELIGKNNLNNFYVVVDEAQSVFTDSRFKSDTEMEFMFQLDDVKNVCFASATPMLDKYLEMIEEFKDLPYVELDWAAKNPMRVLKPNLKDVKTNSVMSEAINVINSYLSGKFDEYPYFDDSGKIQVIVSKEAVLFFNSVHSICELIKRCKLTQDMCNVICANTTANEEKLRQAFGVSPKDFLGIGKVPKNGDPHKMFTFCTRTVYLGADFYSTNARTFIFSDSNIDSLSVDISMDLQQIVGRQRLETNPWKNAATLFYKPTELKNFVTQEKFEEYLAKKKKISDNIIESYKCAPEEAKNDLADALERLSKYDNYKQSYVSVNRHAGSKAIPVFNNLVMVSEMRAFEVQQKDYCDRFTVLAAMYSDEEGGTVSIEKVNDAEKTFRSLTTFTDKMKFACECDLNDTERAMFICNLPEVYNNYYRILGPERIASLSYRQCELAAEFDKLMNNQSIDIDKTIVSSLEVGRKYTKPEIKDILAKAYKDVGYNATAKAVDILPYFNVKECDITDKLTGKRLHGYQILSIKSPEMNKTPEIS